MKKNDNSSEYYEIIEKDSVFKTIFKIILLIIILGACFFAIYKFIIIKPSAIFKSGINKTYKYLDNINKKISYFNEPVAINGVLTADTNNSELNYIDKYKFNLDFNIDTVHNKYSSFIDFNYNNESKAKLLYQLEDYKSYVTFVDTYNKIIELNNNKYKNIKVDKLESILNTIKDNINNQIKDEYLTVNKEEINNNTYDYVELTLNKENLSKITGNIISSIKDDHKLYDNLLYSLDIAKEELDDYLDDILKDTLTKDFNNIIIRYYTKGIFANVIGMKLLIDGEEVITIFDDNELNIKAKYKNYNININNKNNKYNINILDNNEKYLNIIINNYKKDLLDLDYEYKDNKGILHYEIKDNHGNIKWSIINNNTYSINYDFNIIKNEEVSNINQDNIIKMKKLNEDDYLNIYNYYKNNFDNDIIGNNIVKYIEQLLNY